VSGFGQIDWLEHGTMIRTQGFNAEANNGVFSIVPKNVSASTFHIRDRKLVTDPAGAPRTIRVEPSYSAFQNENPYYGGVYMWESYREIRGQRLLTLLHNALRNANHPLPTFNCLADINDDHTVDIADVLAVVSAWGTCPSWPLTCPANIATGGVSSIQVDGDDLTAVMASLGSCP
jgi:hypothetical protein